MQCTYPSSHVETAAELLKHFLFVPTYRCWADSLHFALWTAYIREELQRFTPTYSTRWYFQQSKLPAFIYMIVAHITVQFHVLSTILLQTKELLQRVHHLNVPSIKLNIIKMWFCVNNTKPRPAATSCKDLCNEGIMKRSPKGVTNIYHLKINASCSFGEILLLLSTINMLNLSLPHHFETQVLFYPWPSTHGPTLRSKYLQVNQRDNTTHSCWLRVFWLLCHQQRQRELVLLHHHTYEGSFSEFSARDNLSEVDPKPLLEQIEVLIVSARFTWDMFQTHAWTWSKNTANSNLRADVHRNFRCARIH